MVQYCCCLYAFINSYSPSFTLALFLSLSYFSLVPTCRHNKTTTKLYRTVPHVTAQSWQHCAPTKTDRSFCLFSLLLRVSLINLISMNVNCLHLIRNATVFCLCVLVFFFRDFFSLSSFDFAFRAKQWVDLVANE